MTFDQLDFNGTYTYADYLKWTFAERLELIKGKIFNMSPAPARFHQGVSWTISSYIATALRGKKCKAYSAPFDVRLLPMSKSKNNKKVYTVVQPDICVICDLKKLDDKGCIGAPDLIIEILSPGNTKKEMKDKFDVYEENGVKEYWIVEPNDRAIFVYVLNEQGKYIGLRPFTEDDTIGSSVLPDLQIPVMEIFED